MKKILANLKTKITTKLIYEVLKSLFAHKELALKGIVIGTLSYSFIICKDS